MHCFDSFAPRGNVLHGLYSKVDGDHVSRCQKYKNKNMLYHILLHQAIFSFLNCLGYPIDTQSDSIFEFLCISCILESFLFDRFSQPKKRRERRWWYYTMIGCYDLSSAYLHVFSYLTMPCRSPFEAFSRWLAFGPLFLDRVNVWNMLNQRVSRCFSLHNASSGSSVRFRLIRKSVSGGDSMDRWWRCKRRLTYTTEKKCVVYSQKPFQSQKLDVSRSHDCCHMIHTGAWDQTIGLFYSRAEHCKWTI